MAAWNAEDRLYDLQGEVSATVARLDLIYEKLDGMSGKIDSIADTLPLHNERLIALEAAEKRRKGIGKWIVGTLTAVGLVLIGKWMGK